MKEPFNIPNFGVVVGLFSGLYKLARCLLNRFYPNLKTEYKTYISGMISSLALLLANPGEQSILKMLIYPRALECLFQLLCEKGYLVKFRHGDILAYAI